MNRKQVTDSYALYPHVHHITPSPAELGNEQKDGAAKYTPPSSGKQPPFKNLSSYETSHYPPASLDQSTADYSLSPTAPSLQASPQPEQSQRIFTPVENLLIRVMEEHKSCFNYSLTYFQRVYVLEHTGLSKLIHPNEKIGTIEDLIDLLNNPHRNISVDRKKVLLDLAHLLVDSDETNSKDFFDGENQIYKTSLVVYHRRNLMTALKQRQDQKDTFLRYFQGKIQRDELAPPIILPSSASQGYIKLASKLPAREPMVINTQPFNTQSKSSRCSYSEQWQQPPQPLPVHSFPQPARYQPYIAQSDPHPSACAYVESKQAANPTSSDALPDHKIPVDSPILWQLSQDVREWKFLARFLDLEEEVIEEIDQYTRPNKTRDKSLKMLIEWVNSSSDPTWKALGEAIQEAENTLLYEKLVELVKENSP